MPDRRTPVRSNFSPSAHINVATAGEAGVIRSCRTPKMVFRDVKVDTSYDPHSMDESVSLRLRASSLKMRITSMTPIR
jgi:hypothetical protein